MARSEPDGASGGCGAVAGGEQGRVIKDRQRTSTRKPPAPGLRLLAVDIDLAIAVVIETIPAHLFNGTNEVRADDFPIPTLVDAP